MNERPSPVDVIDQRDEIRDQTGHDPGDLVAATPADERHPDGSNNKGKEEDGVTDDSGYVPDDAPAPDPEAKGPDMTWEGAPPAPAPSDDPAVGRDG